MTEYDSPWKEILDNYFADFMQLCFPELEQAIDWTTPAKMLDKEFQQIAQESETGQRTVDKLVEVRLLTGELEWLLIHLEIQSQLSNAFPRRMFVYYYRITDKYNRPVVSLAVLGDANPGWRPDHFEQSLFGCRVRFEFPMVKLLDFEDRLEELEQSENPFSTVIQAHLMTLKTAGNPVDRSEWKLRLLKPLYRRGMSRDTIRDLFRVIDWMMDLPGDIALQFEHDLLQFEQEQQMPYVTSIERHGIEKGELIGQIRVYQKLLGQPEQPREQFLSQTLEALQSQLSELQQSFHSRARG